MSTTFKLAAFVASLTIAVVALFALHISSDGLTSISALARIARQAYPDIAVSASAFAAVLLRITYSEDESG